jgi:hypothetical protein
MDTSVLQTLRYKLQKRLKRINTADFQIFHSIVVQTFIFLAENPVVRGILDDLERRVPTAAKDSEQLFAGNLLTGENELEHIALCYALLKRTVAGGGDTEIDLGHRFGNCSKHQEAAECFTDLFIEPLFDYIDEQIDDRRTVLGLLQKYKHHVEWFRRNDLRAKFEADTQKGEKNLALDLYAYLHDQGLDFSIEPTSISGEADLISAQTGTDRLVADVKIFDPGKSKGISCLRSGFAQVYQYTKDYNDPFGYLIVFKTCGEDLSVNAREQDVAIPFFTHNNKTIFVLVIDIFDYPESASKRGHLKSYELLEEELIRTISEAAQTAPSDTPEG